MELDPGIIFGYASDFLKEDLGRGDITSHATVRSSAKARGHFYAKQEFVLCGLELAEAVFATLDANVELESRVYDGDVVAAGSEFARVEATGRVLLGGERTALNLLQRLSGVATLTRAFVDRIAGTGAQIVDTRKTTPGLRILEKYAVTVGGGRNHRMSLDDGVLVKDNHIALAGSVRRAVELARSGVSHLLKIEVEVSSEPQVSEALAANADALLLDNLSPEQVRAFARLIREKAPATIIEVSGGITLDNVRAYAETGVDLISVGAITHSAPAVDISMKLTPL